MKIKGILLSTLPYVAAILFMKWLSLQIPQIEYIGNLKVDIHLPELVELSDAGIVFTGAFFVMGLMLAATMSDFKESEKIPGEVACNLEAVKDGMLLALKTYKPAEGKPHLDKNYFQITLREVSETIVSWFSSSDKDSKAIFPALRRLNEIAYHIATAGAEKEAVKGIQDNVNQMRKQITRAYTISRTNFIAPAYVLLKSILFTVITLLFICKFKTIFASYLVTGFVSFIFIYLFILIKGLDNPFEIGKDETEVDLLPLDRFKSRINDGFDEIQ